MAALPMGLQLRSACWMGLGGSGGAGGTWLLFGVLYHVPSLSLFLFIYIFYIQEQKEPLNTVQSLRICDALLLQAS